MDSIIGKPFSDLTVLEDIGNGKLLCRCVCGVIKEFDKYNVIGGKTHSCGCARRRKYWA